jgi:sugar transferase (PEP-CTERM/EpsH1 system associated)
MPPAIRILHVLHAFSHGGLENGIVNIINRSPDHLVHELCFLDRGGEFLNRLNRPVAYHEFHKRPGNDIRLVFRLRELFRRRDLDIIHTRNWAAFDGVLAACTMLGPVVIHGEHGRDIGDPAGMNRQRNLARRALSFRARKLVAVSKDLYSWLSQTVRVPEKKLMLIPNGVDTERFRPGRNVELRRRWGIGDDEFVIGAVGRLDPIKNHAGLLSAIRSLQASGHNVRLVIAGDGPERSNIEGILRSPFSPAPLLLGACNGLEHIYGCFDLFVLNSFAEGMSNTLLEAMASGLPIVCTAVGGNLELVSNGERGILVSAGDIAALADAIRRYKTSPDMRTVHGFNAREFASRYFSIEQMIQRYVGLYESVAC